MKDMLVGLLIVGICIAIIIFVTGETHLSIEQNFDISVDGYSVTTHICERDLIGGWRNTFYYEVAYSKSNLDSLTQVERNRAQKVMNELESINWRDIK